MAESHSDAPKDPKSALEALRGIEFNPLEHKKAAVAIGAAALALGVGVYVLHKRAGQEQPTKVAVTYGDQHMRKNQVISLVEIGEHGGVAAGVPTSEEALDALPDDDRAHVFGMDDGHVDRPLVRPEDAGGFTDTLRTVGAWVGELLSRRVAETESGPEER